MSELVGTQLGQYQITELICRGGMATVYKAYQPALDRDVAIKVLQRAHDSAFATRFKREARAIARLQHPYILPVYDYGEQSGLLYLVLQYIEGGTTLADLFGEPMAPAPALRMIVHVLAALEYAHQRGVIHRDIKPANILMPSPDWPLLGDFGIAKLVNESGPITQGGLLGTAAYMAPEQAVGRQADVRTDLYAMGVVLYELLTGRTPFDAIDPVALLHQHVYDPLPPPRSINSSLPVVVEKVLVRALAKNPDARYQTAAEMAAELGRVADLLERTSERGHLLRLYEAGVRAFEAEQWEGAAEQLGALVAHDQDYDDAAELLELARAAQRHAQSAGRLFRPGALRGPGRRLLRKGQEQEQAGNLAGALTSYKAARAEATPGPARDEAAAAVARLMARMLREKGTSTLGPVNCLRCGREVQPEWAGCPYCFAPLNKALLERERGEQPLSTTALPTLATATPPERPPLPEVDTPPQIMPRSTVPLASARVIDESPPAARRPLEEPVARPAAPARPRSRRARPSWTPLLIVMALLGSGGGIIWASQRRSGAAGGAGVAAAAATATLPPTWTRTPVPPPTNTSTSTPTSTPSPTAPPTDTPSPTAPPTSTPSPTVPPTPSVPVAVSNALLNLRTGPGQEYPSLERYEQGTRFNVLGRNDAGTWLQAQAPDNRIGWLAAQFLQFDGVLSDIPVVAAPPPPQPTARPTARPRPTTRPQPPAPTPPRPEPTPQPVPPTPEPEPPPPQPEPTQEPPPPPPEPEPTDPPPPPEPEPTDPPPPPEPTPPRSEPPVPTRPPRP